MNADKDQYRLMYEASPDAIMLLDEHGFLDCNPATLEMFGCTTVAAFIRRHPSEYSPPMQPDGRESRVSADEKIAAAYDTGSNFFEWTHQKANGDVFPSEVRLTLLRLNNGNILQATVRNISKSTETFMQQTSKTLEMIASGQPAAQIYDAIAWMYEARHAGMRCSMLELKGNQLMHGGAPSLPKAYCEAVNGLQNGPNVGSCGSSTYTGKRVLVEDIATDPKWADLKDVALPHGMRSCWSEPIKDSNGNVLGAFGMYYNHPAMPNKEELIDLESAAKLAGIVMEREQKNRELRKLSHAITQSGGSMIITDREGIIEYVNPAFETLTGYASEEVIGQLPGILKSGNQDTLFYEGMWKTITDGNIFQSKVLDKKKDGSFFPALLTIAPIINHEGEITHFVGSHADMSALENMEHQFLQAQKMEAIGTLVGGIAHDFNNILAGITGNLYLVKKHMQQHPKSLKKLDCIETLSFRAADMIKQLLTFARKDRVSIETLAFTSFIEETLTLLRSSVPENIEIHRDICPNALSIKGDHTQLHQVLMNLVNNARDAVEGVKNPRIGIGLRSFQPDETFMQDHPYFKPGEYAHLNVEDNGCGISEEVIERLFDPFFTTKETGKGSGLGLAMTFGAIKTHHGFVEVESIEGQGANFHIYIPLSEHSKNIALSAQEQKNTEGHGELLLIADDEPYVRETTAEVLEAMGYRVLRAKDGLEAIEIFKKAQHDIALAILDVVMPHCGGIELAQRIREIRPNLPIIFATGYDKEHVLGSNKQIKDSEAISKPFEFDTLQQLIHDKLISSPLRKEISLF